MPNILPVSDLRNYNEVLKNCQVGEPVFLTKMEEVSLWLWILRTMNEKKPKRSYS